MALSLGQIFKPLSDFFINLYSSSASSGVMFRFDRFGSVISDQDFIDPNHPELGYSTGVANEKFADLVNYVPSDAGDGMNIIFRQDAVDTSYFYRLLSPSQPCVSGDAPGSQGIIDAFSNLKADALKKWNTINAESATGLMFEYKPSLASPASWYNKDAAVWTNQQFSISSPSTTQPNPPKVPLNDNIWRLKVSDQVIRRMTLPDSIRNSAPVVKALNFSAVSNSNLASATSGVHAGTALTTSVATARAATALMVDHTELQPIDKAVALQPATAAPTFAVHDLLCTQINTLALKDRIKLVQEIGTAAPTQPVATDSISVSFSYSLVKIDRPWWIDAFVDDRTWYIPATPRGAISTGAIGSPFGLSTLGFVVIKDLAITANWPAADVANSAEATDFGPFKVDGGIAAGKLSHPGIQIIGWLVQTMPNLPPNDPPQ